ncbi:MAG: helix-turn-helix domain-containing protein [Oscillospiraceae bacterium]
MNILKEKATDDMMNELEAAEDYESFAAKNKDIFVKGSVAEYLNRLLAEKDMPLKDAVKNSGIERIYAYHIFSGKKIPSRDKLLAIAIGMKLSAEETQALLKHTCNRPLYPKDGRDSVILYALMNGYDNIKTSALLYDNNFESL